MCHGRGILKEEKEQESWPFMTRCESYLGHALELPTLPGKSGKSLTPSASSSANRLSAGNLAGMK